MTPKELQKACKSGAVKGGYLFFGPEEYMKSRCLELLKKAGLFDNYEIENGVSGDIIMLIGKGHEDYKEIKGVRYPFDERVVIKEILEEIEK